MANKRIEALEKLLAIKDETIKELERQVQLLKNQPPIVVPQIQPYTPANPIYPWSPNPQSPWGTWITISDSSNSVTVDPSVITTANNVITFKQA